MLFSTGFASISLRLFILSITLIIMFKASGSLSDFIRCIYYGILGNLSLNTCMTICWRISSDRFSYKSSMAHSESVQTSCHFISIVNTAPLYIYQTIMDYHSVLCFNGKTYTIPVFLRKQLGINVITSALLYMGLHLLHFATSSTLSMLSSLSLIVFGFLYGIWPTYTIACNKKVILISSGSFQRNFHERPQVL